QSFQYPSGSPCYGLGNRAGARKKEKTASRRSFGSKNKSRLFGAKPRDKSPSRSEARRKSEQYCVGAEFDIGCDSKRGSRAVSSRVGAIVGIPIFGTDKPRSPQLGFRAGAECPAEQSRGVRCGERREAGAAADTVAASASDRRLQMLPG